MIISQAQYNVLRLYAKDKIIKNIGHMVRQLDIETWDTMWYGLLTEMLDGINEERMAKIEALYA